MIDGLDGTSSLAPKLGLVFGFCCRLTGSVRNKRGISLNRSGGSGRLLSSGCRAESDQKRRRKEK